MIVLQWCFGLACKGLPWERHSMKVIATRKSLNWIGDIQKTANSRFSPTSSSPLFFFLQFNLPKNWASTHIDFFPCMHDHWPTSIFTHNCVDPYFIVSHFLYMRIRGGAQAYGSRKGLGLCMHKINIILKKNNGEAWWHATIITLPMYLMGLHMNSSSLCMHTCM